MARKTLSFSHNVDVSNIAEYFDRPVILDSACTAKLQLRRTSTLATQSGVNSMNNKIVLSLAMAFGITLTMPAHAAAHAAEKVVNVGKHGAMMGKEGDDKGGGKKGMMMGKEGDDKGGGKKGMMMGKEGDDKGGGKKGMMMGKEGDDKGGGKKGAMMTPSSTTGLDQNAIGKGTLMNKGGQAAPGSDAMGASNAMKGVKAMPGVQK